MIAQLLARCRTAVTGRPPAGLRPTLDASEKVGLSESKWRRAIVPLLATLTAVLFVAQVHWHPAPLTFVAEVRTETPTRLQLLYARDYGLRQQSSVIRLADSHGSFQRLQFPVDANSARDLRLVVLDRTASVELRGLQLQRLGAPAVPIASVNLTGGAAGTQLTPQQDGTFLLTNSGNEPMAIQIAWESKIKASQAARAMGKVTLGLVFCTAVGLLLYLSKAATLGNTARSSPPATRSRYPRQLVVGALIFGYFAASLFGLNGSSTAFWAQHADRKVPDVGLLVGSPREVRTDEWMLQTPWIFSQASRIPRFPTVNSSIGSGVTPLVINLPVRHWSTLFRPQMWPFFLMGTERAFAFYWNFKIFGLLLGAFLFFGKLTNGKTLLDATGALFLTFSPYVQWWFSTGTSMPEMMAMAFFALWLVAILWSAAARWQIGIAGVGLLLAVENFIFCCYPRFQVPLAYFAAVILLGGLTTTGRCTDHLRRFRVACLAFVLAAAGLVTWYWWLDIADVVRITGQLSYPGQVRSSGGGFSWQRLFAPFLEFSMTERRFPKGFANVCEAAGFLFIAPLLCIGILRDARQRRFDRTLLLQLALLSSTLIFMLFGVPPWLARITGWDYVYATRADLLLGIVTTVLLVRYLAQRIESRATPTQAFGIAASGAVALFLLLQPTNANLDRFETDTTVVGTALIFGVLLVCLWVRNGPATCALLLVPQLATCAFINPVGVGLPALTKSSVFGWLEEAHARRPDAKWIVLGETFRAQALPDFVKATGANVLGGVRCNPDADLLKVVDPAARQRAVSDRYAWVRFRASNADEPRLQANPGLAYTIELPLRPDLLERLGVDFILQVDMVADSVVPTGFHRAGEREECRLLERN